MLEIIFSCAAAALQQSVAHNNDDTAAAAPETVNDGVCGAFRISHYGLNSRLMTSSVSVCLCQLVVKITAPASTDVHHVFVTRRGVFVVTDVTDISWTLLQ